MKTYFNFVDTAKVFDSACTPENYHALTSALVNHELEGSQKRAAETTVLNYFRKNAGVTPEMLEQPNKDYLVRNAYRRHRYEVMELLEVTLKELNKGGFKGDEFFTRLVETRYVADGDSITFRVTNKNQILAVNEVARDHHNITMQQLRGGETVTASPKTYKVAVGTNIRQYLLGQVDYAAFIEAIHRSFKAKILKAIYNCLTNVATKMPYGSAFNLTTQFDENGAKKITTLIEEVNAMNNNQGVIILGTESALANFEAISDVKWACADAKADIYYTGKLGYFRGTELVVIPQVIEMEGDKPVRLIKDDQIFVFPKTMEPIIKFVDFGQPEVIAFDEPGMRQDDTMKYEYGQTFDIFALCSDVFGMINVQA